MVKLLITAKIPEMAIACPTCPSRIFKSKAIGVSKLTGINSEAIKTAQHKDITQTAPQAGGLDGAMTGSI